MDAIGPTSAHFGQVRSAEPTRVFPLRVHAGIRGFFKTDFSHQAAFPEEESVGGGASMQSNKKLHSRKEMMGKLLGQK